MRRTAVSALLCAGVRAGRIVRLVVYWDPSEALEAAGLAVRGRTPNAEE